MAARSFALQHGYDLGCQGINEFHRNRLFCYRSSRPLYFEYEALPRKDNSRIQATVQEGCPFQVRILPHSLTGYYWCKVINPIHNHGINLDIHERAAGILTRPERRLLERLAKENGDVTSMMQRINDRRGAERPEWPLLQQPEAVEELLTVLKQGKIRRAHDPSRGVSTGQVATDHTHTRSESSAVELRGVPAQEQRYVLTASHPPARVFQVPLYSENEKLFARFEQQLSPTNIRREVQASIEPLNLDSRKPTEPMWCGKVVSMLDTGHSGFSAIAEQTGSTSGFKVREQIWNFLGSPRGFFRDPELNRIMSDDEAALARRRMLPGGLYPSFKRREEFQRSSPPFALRLCAFDLWLVAQFTKRPVCVLFQKRSSQSCTYLPLTQMDPRPIGLIQKETDWDAVTVRPGVQLPPVKIGGWGRRAREMTRTSQHHFCHAQHDFARQNTSLPEDGGCGCMPRGMKAEDDIDLYM
ncbi:unnamed protein product [Jaminaea pallidilutea]